jgi:2-hydroxychromene-2-carboxylate isomerase
MYYAQEQSVDLWEYHARMYTAAVTERVNIEDPEVVAGRVHGLLDPATFLAVLQNGSYAKAVTDGNDYAYEKSGVWALPAYRLDGRMLNSVEGAGVTKQQLAEFIRLIE